MRFNTSGPCESGIDYMLPAVERLPNAHRLIAERQYFVVHGPRQSGKTTALLALADELNDQGDKVALYVSCEFAGITGQDDGVEVQLLDEIRDAAEAQEYPGEWLPPTPWADAVPGRRLLGGLRAWARRCPVPIVLLIDEIDTLEGNNLITVLRQLRAGYARRHRGMFPTSVVLCGMREVRDYKAASGGDPTRLTSSSPFNIAVKSMTITNFTHEDITTLYNQHATATGQQFTADAIDSVFQYTTGQPWLVNALAREITVEIGIHPPEIISTDHVEEARKRIIAARATHLDSLVAKLYEPRVQRVIDPIIAGGDITTPNGLVYDDDLAYVTDLGLVNSTINPITIANPIYREVISRLLAQRVTNSVREDPRDYLLPDGRVDIDKLLRGFLAFWRRHGGLMASGEGYNESGVQLVLLGYLYRIVNGGGLVDSEPGVGEYHIDILIRKPYVGSDGHRVMQHEVIELKVWRDKDSDPVDQGLDQLDVYLGHLGLDAGTLVIFDRRTNAPPLVERGTFTHETTADGRKIRLVRL